MENYNTIIYCSFNNNTPFRLSGTIFLTRNIVTLGLNASGEVGVFRNGWTIVIEWWELCRDVCMPWNQNRRQNWRHRDAAKDKFSLAKVLF